MVDRPFNTQQPGAQMAQGHVIVVALGVDLDQPIWTNKTGAPVEVTSVTFTPEEAHTGADTNFMTLGIVNKELVGVGTVIVAPQKDYDNGVDLIAYAPDDIPVSTTEADRIVEIDEVLAFSKFETGNGLEQPPGQVQIEYKFV